jgi:hypothetical protein
MTPQGQALNAIKPPQAPQGPQGMPQMASGGKMSLEQMRDELMKKFNPEPIKASEALGQHEGKNLKVTQTDRTKVGEGYLGGPGFSSLQHIDPDYANAAWGVQKKGAGSKILNANDPNSLWSTFIGSPTQHTSNQMVFDKLVSKFKAGIKSGKMSPELRDMINAKLASDPVFEGNADISGKNFFKNLKTFEQRRIFADLMGGKGVGGKPGQIFDYDKLVHETTEPELRGAPTYAVGPRLFTLTGERSIRPDLHPAFPHILHGEDLGVMMHPVPIDVMMRDFLQGYDRKTSHMDYTRNTPSQHLTEEFLTHLQKHGHKKGGKISKDTMTFELTMKKKGK